MADQEIEIGIDVGRVLYGLSRIGYTTSSAIADIIDNSVRAEAQNIFLLIQKEHETFSDSKRNNVKEYIIIDDGNGMDDEGIKEALKLGSSELNYEDNTLAKFGLGLKSAAFSQADVLQVISKNEHSDYSKYVVSLNEVIKQKKYFAIKSDIDDRDKELTEKYLGDSKGTIIRLSNVRKVNHPSVKKTISELKIKTGVIYYYFLKEKEINIDIAGKKIEAVDPLFVDEADSNGNLDENSWEGKEVRWIEKNTELTLDDDSDIKAEIEITQLPYPPIFVTTEGRGADKKIRDQYMIGSGNYGFYVYRNKRLISWASHLQGIIPVDQDYYAFRGRILINDTADDYFNIDVKKSTISLSEEAWSVISDYAQEAKRKSRVAWKGANDYRKSIINKQPNEISNIIAEEFDQLDILPGDTIVDEEISVERMKEIEKDMEAARIEMTKMSLADEGKEYEDIDNISPEQKEKAIKGEVNDRLSKIFRVTSVVDNLLWEPYYDTDQGNCVRINRFHRFARQIFEENRDNQDMQVIFDLLLLQLSEAELYAYKNIEKYNYEELRYILKEFRRIISEFLANMCRKLETQLPPNYIENYD